MSQSVSNAVHPWVAEGKHRIRFATSAAPLATWPELRGFVQHAETLGFDAFWANDHPLRIMDCWSQLAALAVSTSRIRLFPLVNCVLYRSAAQTARLAADVDRLSGGRAILGLGIGDDTDEFNALGIPFPPARERQQQLEHTVAQVRGYWTGVDGAAAMAAAPVQQPSIPILIAGGGEKVTLRQVARFADMANFGPHEWTGGAYDVAAVARKLAVLRRHCDEVGRPYDAILRSYYCPLVVLAPDRAKLQEKTATLRPNPREHFIPLLATPDEAIAHYQALADAGMQYFLANTRAGDKETLELLAEHVLPAVHVAA